jgi:hypothetical protein
MGSTWTGDGKRRQAGAPHNALDYAIDCDKDTHCFSFLVHERMFKVE